MATSSLFKQFVIDNEEAVEKFIKALEESEKHKREIKPLKNVKYISSLDEGCELFKKIFDKKNNKDMDIIEPTTDSAEKQPEIWQDVIYWGTDQVKPV